MKPGIFIRIITIGLFSLVPMCAADSLSSESAIQSDIEESKSVYKSITGNEPKAENLLKSLGKSDARGAAASEIIASLFILSHSDPVKLDNAVMNEVERCFTNNQYWLIKVSCAQSLLRLDSKRGVELSKLVLNDEGIPLEGRISLASALVDKGILIGYPVLRDSLNQLRAATTLLEEFKKYDGAIWDGGVQKVDIKDLEKKFPKIK